MINNNNLRIELLNKIIENINNWDGDLESAIELISLNNNILEQLKSMSSENNENSIYEAKLKEAIKLLDDFLLKLKDERTLLLDKNKQLGQKDKILKNYFAQIEESIFIDKDIL